MRHFTQNSGKKLFMSTWESLKSPNFLLNQSWCRLSFWKGFRFCTSILMKQSTTNCFHANTKRNGRSDFWINRSLNIITNITVINMKGNKISFFLKLIVPVMFLWKWYSICTTQMLQSVVISSARTQLWRPLKEIVLFPRWRKRDTGLSSLLSETSCTFSV